MKGISKACRRLVSGALCLAVLLAAVLCAERALLPERLDYGATWSMYLKEPKNSIDLLVLGSSIAYCDVIPAKIYEDTALTAYVMAGPEQTIPQTYYTLREALKTQSPSAVLLEITGVMFDRYQSYSRINVGYMPRFSLNRLGATINAAEKEERFGLLFPLFNYHDRWQHTDPRSLFRARRDEKPDIYAGATLMTLSRSQQSRGEREYHVSEEDYAANISYLKKIEELCGKKGIKLVLFQAPSCACIPEERMERIRSVIDEGTELRDFNAGFDGMGLDMETDFYDFLHCSVYGAVKFSAALSEYVRTIPSLSPRGHDRELWARRVSALDALLE